MNWPQWTVIALALFGLGIVAAKNGEPRPNFSFVETLISNSIMLWLLWMGGFFL